MKFPYIYLDDRDGLIQHFFLKELPNGDYVRFWLTTNSEGVSFSEREWRDIMSKDHIKSTGFLIEELAAFKLAQSL